MKPTDPLGLSREVNPGVQDTSYLKISEHVRASDMQQLPQTPDGDYMICCFAEMKLPNSGMG